MKAPDLQQLEADCRALIASQQTLLLATCNDGGDADISYAPFLQVEHVFYLYVSRLARHTGNLLARRQASVLFIQPEAEAANPFARQRLTLDCQVTEIGRDDALYPQLLDAMQLRFGEIVGLLRTLPDFHLLALTPQQGRYVAGFGKAFDVDVVSGELVPVVPAN